MSYILRTSDDGFKPLWFDLINNSQNLVLVDLIDFHGAIWQVRLYLGVW